MLGDLFVLRGVVPGACGVTVFELHDDVATGRRTLDNLEIVLGHQHLAPVQFQRPEEPRAVRSAPQGIMNAEY